MKQIWHFLTSVRVSIYLLFLVALNLAVGAYYIQWFPDIFRPLNKMSFFAWQHSFPTEHDWWLFVLLFLLVLLGMNTVACTTERLANLFGRRRDYSLHKFLVLMAPSLMHIFFLVALSGHALSLFVVTHTIVPIAKGETIVLPMATMTVKDSKDEFWDNPLLEFPLKQSTVMVDLITDKGTKSKEIRFLRPFWFNGWKFTLDANPKVQPGEPISHQLLLKKDPGTSLILTGGGLLSVVMAWYFVQVTKSRNKSGA